MDKKDVFLTGDRDKDTARATYLIFISSVAILSFVVALMYYVIRDDEVSQVLYALDTFYAIVFFVDFILRLRAVEDKRHYMLHWGWLDLITTFPGVPALRIIRSITAIRDARQILQATPDEIEEQARDRLAESVLYITIFIGLIILSIGSVAIVIVEADAPNAIISTGYDAIWWSLVTVSTVGYGDEYPVTVAGRIIGVFMLLIGVALFTTITSYLASTFTDKGARKQRNEQIELARENAQHLENLLERIITLEEKIADKLHVEEDQNEEDEA